MRERGTQALTKLCAIIKVFTLSLQRFVRIPSPIMPKSPHALYRESQAQATPPKRRGPRLSVRPKLPSKHLQPFHNPHQFSAQPRSLNCVIVRNGIRQKAFKFLDMVVKSGHHLSVQNQRNHHQKRKRHRGVSPDYGCGCMGDSHDISLLSSVPKPLPFLPVVQNESLPSLK